MDNNFRKTVVFGPGSIFDNYLQAEAYAYTLSHWCPECNSSKSAYVDAASLLCCETCKKTLFQPIIRITTEKEEKSTVT